MNTEQIYQFFCHYLLEQSIPGINRETVVLSNQSRDTTCCPVIVEMTLEPVQSLCNTESGTIHKVKLNHRICVQRNSGTKQANEMAGAIATCYSPTLENKAIWILDHNTCCIVRQVQQTIESIDVSRFRINLQVSFDIYKEE